MKVRSSIAVSVVLAMCVVLSACKVTSDQVAAGVNKYALSLQAFQQAELDLHGSQPSVVPDVVHYKIVELEITAAKAGHDLDAAIQVASTGGDISQYIDVANKTFDDVLQVLKLAPDADQKMQTAAQAASDALKNAISLIQALKAEHPSPAPTPAPTGQNHVPLTLLFAFFMPLMAAGASGLVSAANIVTLLQVILQLEPIAFDLILKLATSLKGKTAAEILAMNESIFTSVETIAEAELAKKPPTV